MEDGRALSPQGPDAAAKGVASTVRGVSIRRALGRVLVFSLCVAAFTAAFAIATGSFDEDEVRVVATSLGFAVFSATAAAGGALRLRSTSWERGVGVGTVWVSALAFVLLLAALWLGPDDEDLWRTFGTVGLVTLGASHASVVLGARRATDTEASRRLVAVSIVLGAVDSALGVLPLSGAVEIEDGASYAKVVGVLVVGLLLTTTLPPILRRLVRRPERDGARLPAAPLAIERNSRRPTPSERMADEVLAIADRIDELAPAPDVRAECARLRELARLAGR